MNCKNCGMLRADIARIRTLLQKTSNALRIANSDVSLSRAILRYSASRTKSTAQAKVSRA